MFFVLGVGVFQLLFFNGELMLSLMTFDAWLMGILFLFFLGIFYHLYFFTRAIMIIVGKKCRIEKK